MTIKDVRRLKQENDNKFEPSHNLVWGVIVAVEGSISPPNRINQSWVDIYDSSNSRLPALNDSTIFAEGTPVRLAPIEKPPFLKIDGIYDDALDATSDVNLGNYNVPNHAQNHQYTSETNKGLDALNVYQPALQPLKTTGDGVSLVVTIQSLNWLSSGRNKFFAGTTLDLSSSVPTTGTRQVLIYFDTQTNTIEIIDGVASVSPIPVTFPLIPENTIPSCYVELTASQTTITTSLHITDARAFINTVGELDIPDLLPIRTSGTGLIDGGVVTISTPTTINIDSGQGQIVDNTVDPPTLTIIEWGDFKDVAITGIASEIITDIAINSAGAVVQQNTPFTREQYRNLIILARVSHPNFTSLVTNASIPMIIGDNILNIMDLNHQIGSILSAYVYSGVSTTLNLDRSAGETFKLGVNKDANPKDPNVREDAPLAPVPFAYSYRDGVGGFTYDLGAGTGRLVVDPDFWDDGTGTLNTVGNNNWSTQRIYIANLTGGTVLQYGQEEYNTLGDALVSLFNQEFITDPALQELTTFWGWLVLEEGETDLDNAVFVEAVSGNINNTGNSVFQLFVYQEIADTETFDVSTLYRLNASLSSSTLFLPPSPGSGDFVEFVIQDIAEPFSITIDANGSTIDGNLTLVYENDFDKFRRVRFIFNGEWHAYVDNAGVTWGIEWEDQTYDINVMVRAGTSTWISNTITSDDPTPQPKGDAVDLLPDDPSWVINAIVDTVTSGVQIDVNSGLWVTDRISAWVQDITGSTKYRVVVKDLNSGDFNIGSEFDGSGLAIAQWVDVNIDSIILTSNASFQVLLLADNHSATTSFNGNWIHSTGNTDIIPSAGESFRRLNRTYIRFNDTDNDSGARETELLSVTPGTTLTSSLGASYTIIDVIDDGLYVEYQISVDSEPTTGLQNWVFTIPTPTSTDAVELTNYWGLNPQPDADIQGVYAEGTDALNLDSNAYGVRLRFQEFTISDDWDLVAIFGSLGGVSGGGTEYRYLDIPSGGYNISPSEFIITDNQGVILPVASTVPDGSAMRIHARGTLTSDLLTLIPSGSDTVNGVAGIVSVPGFNTTWEVIKISSLDWTLKQVENWNGYQPISTSQDLLFNHYYILDASVASVVLDLPLVLAVAERFRVIIWVDNVTNDVDIRAVGQNINGSSSNFTIPAGTKSELLTISFSDTGDTGWNIVRSTRLDRTWQPTNITLGDSYHTGNIAIGHTVPGAKLDVKGTPSFFAPLAIFEDTTDPGGGATTLSISNLATSLAVRAYGSTTTGILGGSAGLFTPDNMISGSGSGSKTYFFSNNNTASPELTINAGNVGIGTTLPNRQLLIEKSTTSPVLADIPGITIRNTNTVGASFSALAMESNNGGVLAEFFTDGNDSFGVGSDSFYMRASTNHPILFGTNSTIRMMISNAGNVGIGTTSPETPLDVRGTIGSISTNPFFVGYNSGLPTTSTNLMTFYGGGTFGATRILGGGLQVLSSENWVTSTNSGTSLRWVTTANGTYNTRSVRMTLSHDGKLGIGTTAPATHLHVNSGVTQETARFEGSTASPFISGYRAGTREWYIQANHGANRIDVTAENSRVMAFRVNGAVRVQINTDGGMLLPGSVSGASKGAGTINISGRYYIDGIQVVSNRVTGWGVPTGTATRTTFATGSVTLVQLAERVKAIIDDLTTHGLIGA